MNITIRGINPEFWRDFKAEAVRDGLKMGEAINQALLNFLKDLKIKKKKKNIQISLI